MEIFSLNCRAKSLVARKASYTVTIALLLMIFSGITGSVKAQVSQTLYFMDRIPQSSFLNPAFGHHHNFHLGLPMISSFNVNTRTNFVNFNDLFFKHPQQDSLISFLHPDADINDFTSKLRDRNKLASDFYANLLSFGVRADRSFFSFSISERASMRGMLPKDLILLGLHGNSQFAGKSADFSSIGIDLNYFREYAAGYSYQVDDKLNVGVRAKLLFGKANISFSDSDITLYTDPESYNMRLRSNFTVNMSMPVTIVRNEDGEIEEFEPHFGNGAYSPANFIFNSKNAGFAMDLGATYRLMEEVTLFASVTDLGFIGWKEDVYNITMDEDFEFEGIDLSAAFDQADDSKPADNFLDSLQGRFNLDDTRNSYNRGLPARVYLGGSYKLNQMLSFGLLSRSEIYSGGFEQAVTLSANSNIGRWLSASMSYSVMNNSYNNLGLGLALRGGGFQLYVVSDNLSTAFMPHRTKNAHVWFGLNLVFGHRKDRQIGAGELREFGVPLNSRGVDKR